MHAVSKMSSSQGSSSAVSRSLALLLCVLVLAQYAEAVTVNVGGTKGWTLGYNYKTWAATTRVKPWDSMFFKYDPRLHNVLVVSKADYDACRVNRPWATYKSGKDYVKFTKSGTYYLICGIAQHCQAGMKVAVNVRW
ncbi:hypothetical protein MPTK1_1g07620 [Marchantia polymorpha subsp. ruderalis]|uniref:Phytocyanin domain-containing protein n=3 Tax=Marchantia polymorpha TaxID=3197 RepID=A0AAF6AMM1_MARPO|nr:hypothetical protein MARPO_0036s0008 [Marchantia polymorpha]BBM97691.1 hypothetical protein Mp_1g07620 [Marchantia polymorpha subsp. ruderalis]|eukprot:PTQ40996.1 hypothetical protein MARPO_0036s0008 [Marchantia polymorpha]